MARRKRKRAIIFLILFCLMTFFSGCAGVSKDTKVRCPKCGAIFSVSEGLKGSGGGM